MYFIFNKSWHKIRHNWVWSQPIMLPAIILRQWLEIFRQSSTWCSYEQYAVHSIELSDILYVSTTVQSISSTTLCKFPSF